MTIHGNRVTHRMKPGGPFGFEALCGASKPPDYPLLTTTTETSVTCGDCKRIMSSKTESTTPQTEQLLRAATAKSDSEAWSPEQVDELENEFRREFVLSHPGPILRLSYLCRTLKAAWARIEELTTDWCQCGHKRDKHSFFSDHDECYECDQASEDLCCEWRPAPRPNENAALREQLESAQQNFIRRTEQLVRAEQEIRGVLDALGEDAIHSRPDGGEEDIYESLAISVVKLQSRVRAAKAFDAITDRSLKPELAEALDRMKDERRRDHE